MTAAPNPAPTPLLDVLVRSVDDTALLTYNYEISEDFGFNPTTNAEFVLAQRFPDRRQRR